MPPTDAEFDPKVLPQSATGDYTFANVDNLEHCAKYLNQTMVTFGFPASLDLFSNDPVSISRTCNCMYSLLQQRQRDLEFRESANELRQRQQSDIARLEAKVERLDAQLQHKDREIATITRTKMPPTDAEFDPKVRLLSPDAFSLDISLVIHFVSCLPHRDYTFANVDNLEHCAKYLNQTMVTFGFPASLDLFSNDPVSISRTCNCMYSLLQQRQRDLEFRESANELRQRQQSDIARLEAKVERLDAQLQHKDREIATITRTEAKNTAALKSQIEKLQQERDEFQRMVIGNQIWKIVSGLKSGLWFLGGWLPFSLTQVVLFFPCFP
ncbi:hypothetical protein F2Q70_00007880 [Brassica cretica]|uniref:Uncharacterized protein n=1 Tax=Brassica cretica TaxID=69181 RepID=A0A8S9M0W0_BRACR|nr:hypothetical protein F2Q70_00007880 [Brassica cretica]